MELTHLVVVLVPTSVFLSVVIGLRGILILIVKIFFIHPILLAHKLLVQFVLKFRILGLRVYVIDFLVVITLKLLRQLIIFKHVAFFLVIVVFEHVLVALAWDVVVVVIVLASKLVVSILVKVPPVWIIEISVWQIVESKVVEVSSFHGGDLLDLLCIHFVLAPVFLLLVLVL